MIGIHLEMNFEMERAGNQAAMETHPPLPAKGFVNISTDSISYYRNSIHSSNDPPDAVIAPAATRPRRVSNYQPTIQSSPLTNFITDSTHPIKRNKIQHQKIYLFICIYACGVGGGV